MIITNVPLYSKYGLQRKATQLFQAVTPHEKEFQQHAESPHVRNPLPSLKLVTTITFIFTRWLAKLISRCHAPILY